MKLNLILENKQLMTVWHTTMSYWSIFSILKTKRFHKFMAQRDRLCVASPQHNWGFGPWILELQISLSNPTEEKWIESDDNIKYTGRVGLDVSYLANPKDPAKSSNDVIWFSYKEFGDLRSDPGKIEEYFDTSDMTRMSWSLDFERDKSIGKDSISKWRDSLKSHGRNWNLKYRRDLYRGDDEIDEDDPVFGMPGHMDYEDDENVDF